MWNSEALSPQKMMFSLRQKNCLCGLLFFITRELFVDGPFWRLHKEALPKVKNGKTLSTAEVFSLGHQLLTSLLDLQIVKMTRFWN